MTDRAKLTTEKRNENSSNIDMLSTFDIVRLINSEDKLVAEAVALQSKQIAAAVDMIVERMLRGGRLIYVGAGTSGRLGVLDASECPPTFGTEPSLIQGIIAGGNGALVRSVEGAEDHPEDGARQIDNKQVRDEDVVVGIAACGVTPFVRGALERARQLKAAAIFFTCAPESVHDVEADVIINPVVGPEVITGSTRMKAGTATKLVLNILTSASMIRLGKVHGNLMVDLKATNDKLRDRAIRIVMELTGLSRDAARKVLDRARGELKPAVVMYFHKVDYDRSVEILRLSGESLRKAIEGKS